MSKTLDGVRAGLFRLLSPERCTQQCEVDSDSNINFDLDSHTIEAYRTGVCYAIQVIRQELIAGDLIPDDLAATLDAIQWRLQ